MIRKKRVKKTYIIPGKDFHCDCLFSSRYFSGDIPAYRLKDREKSISELK